MVWLGHSSWYLQLAGKRILIDPVLSSYAAPFSFINKAFPGDYPWRAEGMPEIDLLIISHDHYDHLDYATIRALLPKIKRVITPLGVGSHLRYWGMDGALITEAGLAAGGTGQRRAHRPRAAGAALFRPWAEA
nr:beta-lactamase superfamily domain protein [uncultured bacterium]